MAFPPSTELVITRIWVWSYWGTNICHIIENRSETDYHPLWIGSPRLMKFQILHHDSFERWRVTIIIIRLKVGSAGIADSLWITPISRRILLTVKLMWNIRNNLICSRTSGLLLFLRDKFVIRRQLKRFRKNRNCSLARESIHLAAVTLTNGESSLDTQTHSKEVATFLYTNYFPCHTLN